MRPVKLMYVAFLGFFIIGCASLAESNKGNGPFVVGIVNVQHKSRQSSTPLEKKQASLFIFRNSQVKKSMQWSHILTDYFFHQIFLRVHINFLKLVIK